MSKIICDNLLASQVRKWINSTFFYCLNLYNKKGRLFHNRHGIGFFVVKKIRGGKYEKF